jgi:hypothetical protein
MTRGTPYRAPPIAPVQCFRLRIIVHPLTVLLALDVRHHLCHHLVHLGAEARARHLRVHVNKGTRVLVESWASAG